MTMTSNGEKRCLLTASRQRARSSARPMVEIITEQLSGCLSGERDVTAGKIAEGMPCGKSPQGGLPLDWSSMLDFHNHLMPGVDDGAADLDESRSGLSTMAGQGVTTIITTPHIRGSMTTRPAELEQYLSEKGDRLL